MSNYTCTGNCRKCGKCGHYIADSETNSIKNQILNFPSDFSSDYFSSSSYGVAFDLGTTTVCGTLWNLENASHSGSFSLPNYQREYGPDVISRILFCNQSDENLLHMQKLLLQCMNRILDELCTQNRISSSQITQVTLVGNSTMSHLVLGEPPCSLAVAPFRPLFVDAQTLTAAQLGLNANPQATVFLLPNIGGHVGSDTVGMILATRIYQQDGCHLAVDIGTNGELATIKDGKMLVCSTAAGPAFESASIHHGMCAAPGAIDSFEYNNYKIKITTIDNQNPVGICGSGLIDAVSCLLNCGIIDKSGRMLTYEEALGTHLPQTLVRRLTTYDGMPAFILAFSDSGHPILLTQKDIREIQLAKGAILAGIKVLMQMLDITTEDIDSILLAGAFGNYIHKESALKIGLLPQLSVDKIISVGNAAGTGASMALLSEKERIRANDISKHAKHIDLSTDTAFQNFYIESLLF